jgi:hypothetical protein
MAHDAKTNLRNSNGFAKSTQLKNKSYSNYTNSSASAMPTNQGPVWQHSNPFTHNMKAFKSQSSSDTGIIWTLPQAKQSGERRQLQ